MMNAFALILLGIVLGIIIGIKIAPDTTKIETDKVKVKDSPGATVDVDGGLQGKGKGGIFRKLFKHKTK